MPAKPPRPKPDCLKPPNGVAGFEQKPYCLPLCQTPKILPSLNLALINKKSLVLVSLTELPCKFFVKTSFKIQLTTRNYDPRVPTRAHLPLLHSCPGGVRHANAARGDLSVNLSHHHRYP